MKMITMKVIVLISVFVLNTGFLLKDQNPTQSESVSNQYPSMAKYLADQSSMHHELETLRRQQEMSMNLLTSQLEQKLAEMETKIPEQPSRNDTCKVLYEKLEQNVQKVEQNNTRLAGDLETLHLRYNLLNKAFENTTAKLENSLQELKQLKNIQQLQTLNNLNEKMQKIDSSVSSLRSHEQARNQDFLALYNLTIQSETEINRKMTKYQTDLQNVDKEMNNKITELQQNVSNKVALTACVDPLTYVAAAEAIKFKDIRTNIGNPDLSSFRSTGLYVCTVSDLYHISAVLILQTKSHRFHIMKNNNRIVSAWVDEASYWHSQAVVTATWLQVGDTVKVTSEKSGDIGNGIASCLTIVRIS